MHSTRVLVVAMVVSVALGFALRPPPLFANAISPDERISRSIEKVSDQLREMTQVLHAADRNVECHCK